MTSRPLQAPATAQAPLEPPHRGNACPSDFSAEMDLLGTGAWGFSINHPFQVCRRKGGMSGMPTGSSQGGGEGTRALWERDRNGPGSLARLRGGVAPCGDFPGLMVAVPVTAGPAAGSERRKAWTKRCCRRPPRRPREPWRGGASTEPSLGRVPREPRAAAVALTGLLSGLRQSRAYGAAARAAELLPVPAGSGG